MAHLSLLHPDMVAFPEPEEITPHALAFARMMFAHATLEREIAALQDVIAKEPGFGEQRPNQWGARARPARMVALIMERRGCLPQTGEIEKLLKDAIDPCEQRNLPAHGTWWGFNRQTATVYVRGATRWEDAELPEHREYTAADIEAIFDKLATIEVELWQLRRAIEPPPTEHEIRGEAR